MVLDFVMLLFDHLSLNCLRSSSLGWGSRHGEARGQGENSSYCQGG